MKTNPDANILDHYLSGDRSTLEVQEALKLTIKALRAIADCNESDLAKYCAKVDGLAVDALVKLECSF